MKTRKIYISLFCIAVIAIATGTVYFFHDEKEYIIDNRIYDADYVNINIHNLYSEAANYTEAANETAKGEPIHEVSIFYSIENTEEQNEFIKYLKKIEILQEDIDKRFEMEWDNLIYVETLLSPPKDVNCDKEKIYYEIALGKDRTGDASNKIQVEEGKKFVYVKKRCQYGYDTSYGKGKELFQQEIERMMGVMDTSRFQERHTNEYLFVDLEENIYGSSKWYYYCQMDEEDYNALFDLQYNTTESIALNKSKYQKENQ